MRLVCFIFLLITNASCIAQQAVGIKFEKGLNWVEIKQKARKENKFIFLDAYTTWCAPCRYMAKYIFPQPQVGDFFNKHFINIAVQIDTTKKDNKYVKSWYNDAKMISNLYKIDAYPTYLFFNQDGILVHIIKGASNSANNFISKAKDAFDPKTQYLNLKNEYEKGNRDSVFLLSLIKAAKDANDDSLDVFINTYLKTQGNLLTQQNINFIARGTRKINDIGFYILLNYPKEVNAVIGKSERIKILSNIVFNEQIYPLLSNNAKITYMGGGMIIYKTDSLKKNVNWTDIGNKIAVKYKDITKPIVLHAQLEYYEWLNDWGNFNNCLINYTSNGNEIDTDFIDTKAWNFVTFCDDKKYFKDAIKWASVLVENETHPYYFQTFSRLLYKAGEKESAIKYMQKCALLLKAPNKSINETIEKMRKGEKIE
ncbi:MAG TPA: thioredoxin fold domain-containing protein [Hanamia sp.]